MENFSMLCVHFNGLLIRSIKTKTSKVQDTKDTLELKQIEKGRQIGRQGQLLSAILFEAFPYFKCFLIPSVFP